MPSKNRRPVDPVSAVLWVVVVLVGGSALTYIASVVLKPILAPSAEAEVADAPPPSPPVDEDAAEVPEAEAEDPSIVVADFRTRTETLLASVGAIDRSTDAACLAGVQALSDDVAALEEDTHKLPRELTLLASASRYTILCASCDGSSARNCERARNDLRDFDAR